MGCSWSGETALTSGRVRFASDIRNSCEGGRLSLVTVLGYNDEVCPPTSTYAADNVIKAPTLLAIETEQAHTHPTEQWEMIDNWVVKQLVVEVGVAIFLEPISNETRWPVVYGVTAGGR